MHETQTTRQLWFISAWPPLSHSHFKSHMQCVWVITEIVGITCRSYRYVSRIPIPVTLWQWSGMNAMLLASVLRDWPQIEESAGLNRGSLDALPFRVCPHERILRVISRRSHETERSIMRSLWRAPARVLSRDSDALFWNARSDTGSSALIWYIYGTHLAFCDCAIGYLSRAWVSWRKVIVWRSDRMTWIIIDTQSVWIEILMVSHYKIIMNH